jgi:hypothetical protein
MKKLIVLAIVMLLVGMGAFADTTVAGEIEYQAGSDLKDGYKGTTVVELNFTATATDYDTAHIDLEVDGGARDGGILEEAWFVSDLGGRFMLPIGLNLYYGFEEYESAGVGQVSFAELEYGILDWNPQGWGTKVSIGPIADVATLDVVWLYSNSGKWLSTYDETTATPSGPIAQGGFGTSNTDYDMLVDLHGMVSGVGFQVAYADEVADADGERANGKGKIGLAADYSMDATADIAVKAGGKFAYDIDAPAGGAGDWAFGVAAGAVYQEMAGLNLVVVGYDESTVNAMAIEVFAMPVELIYVQLVANLGLDSDVWQETFDSLEATLEINVGDMVDFYVGYLFVAENDEAGVSTGIDKDYSEQYPADLGNADATGVIFIGGEIKF